MLETALPAKVEAIGAYLTDKLLALRRTHPTIQEVRGKGLLLAVGFDRDIAERVTLDCLSEGLIANNVRPNALRLCPPLTVTQAECDKAVTIIDKVLNRTNGAK